MQRLFMLLIVLLGTCRSTPAADEFAFFHENVMGTSLELRVRGRSSEEIARGAEEGVLREIERLSAIFSGYDPQSEFSRWLRSEGTPVVLSAELFEVLQSVRPLEKAHSGGAFDPRVRGVLAALGRGVATGTNADGRGARRGTRQDEAQAAMESLTRRNARSAAAFGLSAEPQRDRQVGYIVGPARGELAMEAQGAGFAPERRRRSSGLGRVAAGDRGGRSQE